MVKRLIFRLVFEHGPKLFRSIINAYKDINKSSPKGPNSQQNKNESDSKFGFNNLISTPMTKDEAIKILSIKENQNTPENIMEQFDKYMATNDPEKGGSFYLQNKIYYAKELLMRNFPSQLNISKYNPDYIEVKNEEDTEKSKEEDLSKDKKI